MVLNVSRGRNVVDPAGGGGDNIDYDVILVGYSNRENCPIQRAPPSESSATLAGFPPEFRVMFSRNSSAIAVGADYCDVRSGSAAQVQGGAGGLAAGLG